MKKRDYTEEEIKIMKDFLDQKDETKRLRAHERIEWRIRGWVSLVHYWMIAYSFPISLIIFLSSEDFWKGLGFLIYAQVYAIAGNLRGLGLHIENLVEWNMKKRV